MKRGRPALLTRWGSYATGGTSCTNAYRRTPHRLAVLALSCGCSSRQWNKGSELGENQSYAEQFSKAPDNLSSLLPEDNYTDDMVQALAGSDNYSDKQEYDLLISNYEQYGRYDGQIGRASCRERV